jgi:hypothetical protein
MAATSTVTTSRRAREHNRVSKFHSAVFWTSGGVARGHHARSNGASRTRALSCTHEDSFSAELEPPADFDIEPPAVKQTNPVAEVDRMAAEFRDSLSLFSFKGAGSAARAERLCELTKQMVDENFAAIRARIVRDIETKAAKAGKRN